MKIMAVLAVLLAAALFIRAASAADNVTVTPNVTSVEIGGTVNFTVTNNSVTSSTVFQLINVTGTPAVETTVPVSITLGAGNNVAYIEWTPTTLGTFKFNINTTTSGSALNLTMPVKIEVTTPGNSREVTTGDDVFVYEKIYVSDAPRATRLIKYSDGATPSVVNQISASTTPLGNNYFYLTEAVVNNQFGTYNLSDGTTSYGQISIWYPEISVEAELAASKGDSIDGKTINKDTYVNFLINAPKVGPAFNGAATAKIVFTTPASGKTTDFGYASGATDQTSFNPVPLTSAQTTANPDPVMAGNNETAGTWTAQAEYVTPGAFSDYAKKSNTISFTLQSSTLTITAAKDSVVRSNPFTVTISGESLHQYAVYLETPSNNKVNPTLQGGKVGFKSTYAEASIPAAGYTLGYYTTTGGLIVPALGEIFYDGYYPAIRGVFKTDASGKRTIQFNTDKTTEDKTYTVYLI